jgi:UTP--hexose-1-phosphate uridylyltransferase
MMKRCFLTGEYVFYATDRAKRPHSFKKTRVQTTPKEYCPFCPENEHFTPGLVYASEDKAIRIVENKYPFIPKNSQYFGIHDVLIDTPNHDEALIDFSDEHMTKLIKTIKERYEILEKDERSRYVQVFKNQGLDAGASQSHSHWQITSLCVIPAKMEHLQKVLKKFYNDTGKCYFCNLNFEDRIVEENEDFISYIPADGKFPYGMDILPKRHISSINEFSDREIENFGIILRNSIRRLHNIKEDISYNVCLYSAPKNTKSNEYFHFYAQIIPRIGYMAGFEFSTGCYINSTLPEIAAKELREVGSNIKDSVEK